MTKSEKTINCVVYKASAKPDTYLYILQADDFSDVPDSLMKSFGQTEKVMELALTPKTRLARDNAERVIQDLELQGYHLQMPPPNPTI